VSLNPGILARGPWQADQVAASWSDEPYEPTPERSAAADRAIATLADRGSPSHDGLAARMAGFERTDEGLRMDLQPMRWSLRLVRDDASASLAALCVVRDSDGRWLAGRRAPWVASWAGRWALGAGGAVEVGEDPTQTLTRELAEEWSVVPEREQVEALVCLPNRMVMLIGQAWLAPGTEVTRDHEHDAHAWWPRNPIEWPEQAHPQLRRLATLLDEEAS
jgi:8-oxo-dGTP diphosphatase